MDLELNKDDTIEMSGIQILRIQVNPDLKVGIFPGAKKFQVFYVGKWQILADLIWK